MFEESKHPRDNEGKFTDKLKSAVKIYSDVPDKDIADMGLRERKIHIHCRMRFSQDL